MHAGLVGRNIKMLRSAPARTREGGRRRSAPGLQLGLDGSEGFATMKLFMAALPASASNVRLHKYERTKGPEFPPHVAHQVNFC